jgi:hypothetical protein
MNGSGRGIRGQLSIPSYTTGTRQLRRGMNRIFLTTDGLLKCPNLVINGQVLYELSEGRSDRTFVKALLHNLKNYNVRDSCTLVCWTVECEKDGIYPNDGINRKM